MTESDLKRALLKSLRAQGGDGFRMEDKYAIGRPDLFMLAECMTPFLAEVKLVKGARLECTTMQATSLERFNRPPFLHAVLIGYSARKGALYIGEFGWPLADCRFVPRPNRLDSAEWLITELLWKWYYDEKRRMGFSGEPGGSRNQGRVRKPYEGFRRRAAARALARQPVR